MRNAVDGRAPRGTHVSGLNGVISADIAEEEARSTRTARSRGSPAKYTAVARPKLGISCAPPRHRCQLRSRLCHLRGRSLYAAPSRSGITSILMRGPPSRHYRFFANFITRAAGRDSATHRPPFKPDLSSLPPSISRFPRTPVLIRFRAEIPFHGANWIERGPEIFA